MAHGRQSVRWLITVTTAHFGIILLRCFVVPVTIIRCCLPSIAFIPTYGIPCLSCFMHRSRNTIQSKFDRAFPRTSRFPFCIPFRFDVSLGPRLRRLCLLRSDDTILHCSFSSLFPSTPVLPDLRDVDINCDVAGKFQASWSIYIAPAFVVKLNAPPNMEDSRANPKTPGGVHVTGPPSRVPLWLAPVVFVAIRVSRSATKIHFSIISFPNARNSRLQPLILQMYWYRVIKIITRRYGSRVSNILHACDSTMFQDDTMRLRLSPFHASV